ncbi:type II toxin-antitoxin system RelE/ParE family toxin [Rhizobium sp. CF142]|uniref:type II toxin-antitoxin system RelE/ParE family toxin n=1 Tax=Rhizobium sp. CF142 TaxID=1144314 RepID=UPI001FCB08B8|nr:type II toxin-antitoxin system RelE/ParE family toxin [Rhizobium sp. CF142]
MPSAVVWAAMTNKVVFRPKAEDDLLAIYEFIARDSPVRAIEFVRRLRSLCTSLETMPERGALRDDFAPGVRILVFEQRVTIAYRLRNGEIQIIRLLYAGRNTPSAFRE